MKILHVLAAVFFFFMISSCSKNETEDIKIVKQDENGLSKSSHDHLCTLVEITHPVGQPSEWVCIKPASNCFCEAVIITPETKSTNSISEIYQEFLDAIEQNNLPAFFTGNNWQLLFPLLNEPFALKYLQALKTGNVVLVKKYNPYKDIFLFMAVDKNFTGDLIPNSTFFTLQVKLEK